MNYNYTQKELFAPVSEEDYQAIAKVSEMKRNGETLIFTKDGEALFIDEGYIPAEEAFVVPDKSGIDGKAILDMIQNALCSETVVVFSPYTPFEVVAMSPAHAQSEDNAADVEYDGYENRVGPGQ